MNSLITRCPYPDHAGVLWDECISADDIMMAKASVSGMRGSQFGPNHSQIFTKMNALYPTDVVLRMRSKEVAAMTSPKVGVGVGVAVGS